MRHVDVRTRTGPRLALALVAAAALLAADQATRVSAQTYRARSGLTGTYELNQTLSDNVVTIADRITSTAPGGDRPRMRTAILRRLEPPDSLAIDRQGRTITMTSSTADRVTFEADGRVQTDQMRNGRTMRTVATLTGDRLQINTEGDGSMDYQATFEPLNNGRSLRVTRRISSEGLAQPVVARAVYDRVSDDARLDMYSEYRDRPGRYRDEGGRVLSVADGTEVVATLDNRLSTSNVTSEQPFSLTVQSPAQYHGARIDGRIVGANQSGRVAGRADMSFDFERIQMRNGRSSSDFDGSLLSVRTPDGDTLRVEGGGIEDRSQGERTATRTGIGAAIGAVIGAIAGGGKGAAIGGAVGAGAGAGSVIAQGRDELNLPAGTEFRIRASGLR